MTKEDRTNPSQDVFILQAEALLERLRHVPPQHATAETVNDFRQAASLLDHVRGSPLWYEALLGLGSHLLESSHGDRAANIEGARNAYRTMLEEFPPPDAWEAAALGLANALVWHPTATLTDFEQAAEIYNQLIPQLRARGDSSRLAMALGNQAHMHAAVREGDVNVSLEQAIAQQDEAVRLLADSENPEHAPLRGRARHNLAKYYLQRRMGMRSQNVDRAVRLLQAALADRPADRDPVGRAKTLRGLALAYPEWSGADSQAQANELAAAATAEAAEIEQSNARVAQRTTGWAAFERQKSALSENLDTLYGLPPEERVAWLNKVIANHQSALKVIPREAMPVRWAEWMGGLARLLGRLPSLGIWDHVNTAYDCFAEALAAIDPEEHRRLRRELLQCWGELAHEIGDFKVSLQTYGGAADISDTLFEAFGDPEHQWAEIELTRGYSFFAAYAAARSGRLDEAVRRAEQQRTRSIADLLGAARILTKATQSRRDTIKAAVAQILATEDTLRQLDEHDPEAQLARMRGKLADYFDVDPAVLKMRRIDAAKDASSPTVEERARLRTVLVEERQVLRALLQEENPTQARGLNFDEIQEIVRMTDRALVYLMATVHGGMAVVVLPNGQCEALPLAALTSDLSRGLLYGDAQTPGFIHQAMGGDAMALSELLGIIRGALNDALMAPLESWLRGEKISRAVLVPLGSLGVLPLHTAADEAVAFSYAPSARALALAASGRHRVLTGGALVVADPKRADERALPFAVAESRALVQLMRKHAAVRPCFGADATFVGVCENAAELRCAHFACHGRFRSSEPLASHLLLACDDQLTVADVFSRRVDLSAARLVTLSACQSGNVEFRRAADEALGFPSALLVAGVPGVVSTMWQVDDAAAALFTVRLYELLFRDGLEPADAVTRARIWLRQASAGELQGIVSSLRAALEANDVEADAALSEWWRDLAFADPMSTPYASPTHWAAFILTGV